MALICVFTFRNRSTLEKNDRTGSGEAIQNMFGKFVNLLINQVE